MVQRARCAGGPRPAQRREGMHGHQALRVRDLGTDEGRARWHVQGHRPRQRVLPAVHPQELLEQGGRPRGGLRQRMCGGDALPPEERSRRRRRGGGS